MKDLYKILGVAPDADADTIKKAYRKLAKEFHPDVTGGDNKKTERFKEINEAYDVLGDQKKRAEYERLKNAPVRPDGMPEGFDPDAFAQTFGGGVRMGRGGVSFGGGGVDINDIFASLFGDAAGRGGGGGGMHWGQAQPRQARGADMAGNLDVTFQEAALGTKRAVRSASGRSIEVQIPPGVESGGRLRVPGQGGAAPGKGGTPGDLYLEVRVAPDRHLRREGADVYLDLPVGVAEAALGAKISVPTVDGPVTVTVPPGTSSGAKLRLRGRGIKKSDGSRGDQFCQIVVVVPKGVPDDKELAKLFEEIGSKTAGKSIRDF